jgi:hypothetical protein
VSWRLSATPSPQRMDVAQVTCPALGRHLAGTWPGPQIHARFAGLMGVYAAQKPDFVILDAMP